MRPATPPELDSSMAQCRRVREAHRHRCPDLRKLPGFEVRAAGGQGGDGSPRKRAREGGATAPTADGGTTRIGGARGVGGPGGIKGAEHQRGKWITEERRLLGDQDISAHGLQCSRPRPGHADMWNRQYAPSMPVYSLALVGRRLPRDVPKRVMFCCAPVGEGCGPAWCVHWGAVRSAFPLVCFGIVCGFQ